MFLAAILENGLHGSSRKLDFVNPWPLKHIFRKKPDEFMINTTQNMRKNTILAAILKNGCQGVKPIRKNWHHIFSDSRECQLSKNVWCQKLTQRSHGSQICYISPCTIIVVDKWNNVTSYVGELRSFTLTIYPIIQAGTTVIKWSELTCTIYDIRWNVWHGNHFWYISR